MDATNFQVLIAVLLRIFANHAILAFVTSFPEATHALEANLALFRLLVTDAQTIALLGPELVGKITKCTYDPKILESFHELLSVLNAVLGNLQVLEMIDSTEVYNKSELVNRLLAQAVAQDIRTAQELKGLDLWNQLLSVCKVPIDDSVADETEATNRMGQDSRLEKLESALKDYVQVQDQEFRERLERQEEEFFNCLRKYEVELEAQRERHEQESKQHLENECKQKELFDKKEQELITRNRQLEEELTQQAARHEREKTKENERTRDAILVMGGYNESSVETFDFETRRWTRLQNIADPPRGETYVFSWENKVLVIEVDEKRVRSLDLNTWSWTKKANMITFRDCIATAISGDQVYAMGGRLEGKASNNAEVYDLNTDTWREIRRLTLARSSAAGTSFKGSIYCAGGLDNSDKDLSSVERFDPNRKTWTQIAPLSTPRTALALSSCKYYVWAFGGYSGDDLNGVERLDPVTGVWTRMAPMTISKRCFPVVPHEGRFYAIGGFYNKKDVEAYDTRENKWEECPALNKGRGYHGACLVQLNLDSK